MIACVSCQVEGMLASAARQRVQINPYSAGSEIKRQYLTSVGDPRTERIKKL